jgi:hypothetical protein
MYHDEFKGAGGSPVLTPKNDAE